MRATVAALAVAALITLTSTGVPAGQDPPKVEDKGKAVAPTAPTKKRLVFGLRTDAEIEKERLVELLKDAKKQADAKGIGFKWTGDPLPRPISAQMYKTLEAFTRDGGVDDLLRRAEGEGVGPRLESYPGSPVWLIDLGSPDRSLTEISFSDAAGKAIGNPIKSGSADKRLDLVGLGKYKLSGKIDPIPTKYKLKYTDKGQAQEAEYEWPDTADGHWLIELRDWDGELENLLQVLRKGRFRTPIKNVLGVEKTTLALVDLKTSGREIESGWTSKNVFEFRFPLLRDGTGVIGKRMYVLFPLSQDEAEKEVAALKDLKEGPKILNAILKKTPSEAGDATAKFSPDGGPRWYEIPKATDGYVRAFPVENVAGWKAAGKNKSWRVTVYELEPEEQPAGAPPPDRTIASVTHPERKKLVDAIDQQEKQWILGLDRITPDKK